MAMARVVCASHEIDPNDIAPVAKRLTMLLAGSTSSTGTGVGVSISSRWRRVTGSSLWLTSTMSLRLRMMSVTSSTTPGMVSNSCSASSNRTCVMAAPGMDERRVRRSELPRV